MIVTNFVVKKVNPITAIKIYSFNISPLIPFIAPKIAQSKIKESKNIFPLPNKETRIPI
jgi:hypothetical protein